MPSMIKRYYNARAANDKTKSYKCQQCEYITARKDYLRRHKKIVHKLKYHVWSMSNTDGCKSDLNDHKTAAHKERMCHECDQCEYSTPTTSRFIARSGFKEHADRRHVNSIHMKINPFRCNKCPNKFANVSFKETCYPNPLERHLQDLQRHKRAIHDKSRLKCE